MTTFHEPCNQMLSQTRTKPVNWLWIGRSCRPSEPGLTPVSLSHIGRPFDFSKKSRLKNTVVAMRRKKDDGVASIRKADDGFVCIAVSVCTRYKSRPQAAPVITSGI